MRLALVWRVVTDAVSLVRVAQSSVRLTPFGTQTLRASVTCGVG